MNVFAEDSLSGMYLYEGESYIRLALLALAAEVVSKAFKRAVCLNVE